MLLIWFYCINYRKIIEKKKQNTEGGFIKLPKHKFN